MDLPEPETVNVAIIGGVIGAIGTIGAALFRFLGRKQVSRLSAAQEMGQVVSALRTQMEMLMADNERLRKELAEARGQIAALDEKLDRLDRWVTRIPSLRREKCPLWSSGVSCPLIESYPSIGLEPEHDN